MRKNVEEMRGVDVGIMAEEFSLQPNNIFETLPLTLDRKNRSGKKCVAGEVRRVEGV